MAEAYLNGKAGVWRTVGGRRIFIANGQSLKDAMKASGKFKNLKDNNDFNLWKEENSDKIAAYYTSTYSKDLKNINQRVWDSLAKDLYDEEKEPEKINKMESGDEEKSPAKKSINALNEIDRLAGDDEFLQKKGRELGLDEFKKYMEGKPEDFLKLKTKEKPNNNNDDTNKFVMVSGSGKEVTVIKSADGKWIDSDGNRYMSYLSKSDVKSYFKGDWKEVKNNNDDLDSQFNKTMDNKEIACRALGIETDRSWKSTKELYKEQKGIDLTQKALQSGKASEYLELRKKVDRKLYDGYERNFDNMKAIERYAKVKGLDKDALYYTTNLASESDVGLLKKAAEIETNSKMTISQLKQMYINQGYTDGTAARMAKEYLNEKDN